MSHAHNAKSGIKRELLDVGNVELK